MASAHRGDRALAEVFAAGDAGGSQAGTAGIELLFGGLLAVLKATVKHHFDGHVEDDVDDGIDAAGEPRQTLRQDTYLQNDVLHIENYILQQHRSGVIIVCVPFESLMP